MPISRTNEPLAQSLQARLAELRADIAAMDAQLQAKLPADSEEQASELEYQDPFAGIERSKYSEARQIEFALQRMDEGVYGVCAQCGGQIDRRRLDALPTATRCIECASGSRGTEDAG